MVTAVKEPAETQVANSLDTWLSSNRIRVSSREVYILSERFANTLACTNKPYHYIKLTSHCMDLVQYKLNSKAKLYLYIFVCMKCVYFIRIGQ